MQSLFQEFRIFGPQRRRRTLKESITEMENVTMCDTQTDRETELQR